MVEGSSKTCPVCFKNLELKQINFTTAIYICPDLKCEYPVGFNCIEVKRNLEDINKPLPEEKPTEESVLNSTEMDNLFKEIMEMSDNNTDTSKQASNYNQCKELDDLLSFLEDK